jgi:hypothetical protein
LNNVFDELINFIKKPTLFRHRDEINLTILNQNLHHIILTGLITISSDNPIVNLGYQLTRILSSNEHISQEECDFHVTVTAIPQGQGGGEKVINLRYDIRTKNFLTRIKNGDKLCCPRGVITAFVISRFQNKIHVLYLKILRK